MSVSSDVPRCSCVAHASLVLLSWEEKEEGLQRSEAVSETVALASPALLSLVEEEEEVHRSEAVNEHPFSEESERTEADAPLPSDRLMFSLHVFFVTAAFYAFKLAR